MAMNHVLGNPFGLFLKDFLTGHKWEWTTFLRRTQREFVAKQTEPIAVNKSEELVTERLKIQSQETYIFPISFQELSLAVHL